MMLGRACERKAENHEHRLHIRSRMHLKFITVGTFMPSLESISQTRFERSGFT